MASVFQGSPSITVNEIDKTGSVAGIQTSQGGIGGVFAWGPVNQLVLVDQESSLVSNFGRPSNLNPETWFTAANFLQYSNELYVVRAANTVGNTTSVANTVLNAVAVANVSAVSNTVLLQSQIINNDDFATTVFDPSVFFAARYPGALGNSLRISVIDSALAYSSTINVTANNIANTSGLTLSVGSNTGVILATPTANGTITDTGNLIANVVSQLSLGDSIQVGNQTLKVSGISTAVANGSNTAINVSFTAPYTQVSNTTVQTFTRTWEFATAVSRAPAVSAWQQGANNAVVDQVHIVVTDDGGQFTGQPGSVLEIFQSLSRSTNAKTDTGQSNFYKDVINTQSKYIWAGSNLSGAGTNIGSALVASTNTKASTFKLTGGQNGNDEGSIALGCITQAYDQFTGADQTDIAVLMQGKARGGTNGEALANYIVANVAEIRKDLVVAVSPDYNDVVNQLGNERVNIVQFRSGLASSSYCVLDSGYKYQYDRYNDVYRFIPLNGDTAGVIAGTPDAWDSPAGQARGRIKNVIKLAYNPNKPDRDVLYNNDCNPVISLNGIGPLLYGDKTTLGTTSAFSRIGVRRLFIVLRKSISQASNVFLFEFNDEFTRAQFKNIVDPYLSNVQARRGVTQYQIICDTTNNTPDVINNEGFVGDVYVIPNRSINYISLNFIAVDDGISFTEVEGSF